MTLPLDVALILFRSFSWLTILLRSEVLPLDRCRALAGVVGHSNGPSACSRGRLVSLLEPLGWGATVIFIALGSSAYAYRHTALHCPVSIRFNVQRWLTQLRFWRRINLLIRISGLGLSYWAGSCCSDLALRHLITARSATSFFCDSWGHSSGHAMGMGRSNIRMSLSVSWLRRAHSLSWHAASSDMLIVCLARKLLTHMTIH